MYYTAAPNTAFIANNGSPTTINAHSIQLGSDNIRTNEPTSNCESGPAQVYNSTANTVSLEDYTKAAESVHGWQNAFDKLKSQIGSGINTKDVHKHAVEAIRNWEEAYQN